MTYLSRVTLADRRAETIGRLLDADAYRRHQLVWGLFPGRAGRDFLFRVEADGFLVLSADRPVCADGLWRVQSKPFAPRLRSGQVLAFALTANPTVTRDRKRHDVLMDAKKRGEDREGAATRWLESRADRLGFSLERSAVLGVAQHRFRKSSQLVRYTSVDYAGVLKVGDPERFLETLKRGVGHAKSFGCGLLLVRPVGY